MGGREGGREGLAAAPLAQKVYLPHHLHGPLEVQALLDDAAEHLLCLMLHVVEEEGLLYVVRVLHARQLGDARGTHLLPWRQMRGRKLN